MAKGKPEIIIADGTKVSAQAPVIVSASRSTDIPAFYADWFFNRLEAGYSAWINPFNNKKSYVSFEDTRLIVFWSKNPKPLLEHLHKLKEKNIHSYIQYSLNDYTREGLEKVPSLDNRIDTFKRLVDELGMGKVIWRFDPLILTDTIGVDDLLERIQHIGNQLQGYTEKLVYSYADIESYLKVKNNLVRNRIAYQEFDVDSMHAIAKGLQDMNQQWGLEIGTCGEQIDLEQYGIKHNKCVDDDLMVKYFSEDKKLMEFLGYEVIEPSLFNPEREIRPILKNGKSKNLKDKGQRALCGCIISKDIGQYNTCPHFCEYCYANTSKERALANYKRHQENPFSETIIGE